MSFHKKVLRQTFKDIRSSITDEYRSSADQLIFEKFLEFLKDIKKDLVIAAYWPTKSELDIIPLLHKLHNLGIACALPQVSNDEMSFVKWSPNSTMKKNIYGIYEPASFEAVTPNLMIIPHLACDKEGNRLGYGKGYYDKYLSKASSDIYVVALCYNQLLSEKKLPHTTRDVKVNMIITEFDSLIIRSL